MPTPERIAFAVLAASKISKFGCSDVTTVQTPGLGKGEKFVGPSPYHDTKKPEQVSPLRHLADLR